MGADKILLQRENLAYTPNSQPRIPTRVCQGRVVTADLPTLGTNFKQSRSGSATQEAKDLATLRSARRTVREPGAGGPRTLGGRSATHRPTVCYSQQNDQTRTPTCGRFVHGPRTVREQLVPRRQSAIPRRTVRPPCGRFGTPTRTVRQTNCNKTLTPRKIYA
jgi:hypothetical protein